MLFRTCAFRVEGSEDRDTLCDEERHMDDRDGSLTANHFDQFGMDLCIGAALTHATYFLALI